LVASASGIDQLVPREATPARFDAQAPLLSLPGILRTTLPTIPAAVPYLHADPSLVEQWRRETKVTGGLRIGIAWQGGPRHPYDRQRSIPLSYFTRLSKIPGVFLFSVQKGPGTEQMDSLCPVRDLSDQLDHTSGAFMDTAAVMNNLDLVISCDTAIPHLAGALGVPVWLALSLVPDWRWLLQREDSPWYPTMRLFRQTRPGNWDDVFERIAAELRKVAVQNQL
jgi:hypothetical protein